MNIEDFLIELPRVRIVGGSPLFTGPLPEFAISINALKPEAFACAINCSRGNVRRATQRERVLVPMPDERGRWPSHFMLPKSPPLTPYIPNDKQPTTCFALLCMCRKLKLEVELYGVCGWASKWHDGDWEMHYIKHVMDNVTVHDPRPTW